MEAEPTRPGTARCNKMSIGAENETGCRHDDAFSTQGAGSPVCNRTWSRLISNAARTPATFRETARNTGSYFVCRHLAAILAAMLFVWGLGQKDTFTMAASGLSAMLAYRIITTLFDISDMSALRGFIEARRERESRPK